MRSALVAVVLLTASSALAAPKWKKVSDQGLTYLCPTGWTCNGGGGMVAGTAPDGISTLRMEGSSASARDAVAGWAFGGKISTRGKLVCGQTKGDRGILAACARDGQQGVTYVVAVDMTTADWKKLGLGYVMAATKAAGGLMPPAIDEKEEDGDPDGVEGGVQDGVVGGVIDDGTAPPPPPPPPPPRPSVVPASTLNALRTAGDTAIRPPAEVLAAAQKQGKSSLTLAVKMCLAQDGTPTTVDVVKSSGFPAYDTLVTQTIHDTWRFRPYLVNGTAVPVCTAIVFQVSVD